MGACTVETSMEVSLNMKNRTVTGPGDSTSRCVYIYLKKTNSTNGKRHTQLSVLSSVIHSCQIEKQSVHQQMKGWRRYGGHARVHTHTHVHTHARAHTHTHAHTNVHTCGCPHGRAHVCTCACTYVCTRTHTCVCTRAHAATCAHMHTHTCIHTHVHAHTHTHGTIAAAAKLRQSCPTLCDPIDGSPPGSPVPGILQARTLEWVAISFSNSI